MPKYTTPSIYVDEISNLPPSVSEVASTIPAFLGYTEKAPGDITDISPVPTRISSLSEYNQLFGGPPESSVSVKWKKVAGKFKLDINQAEVVHNLYYALKMFFDNGGGTCYIVSVGRYHAQKSLADFQAGLTALKQEEEPTLIVLSEACGLEQPGDYYTICRQALEQCSTMTNRFCILDVLSDDINGKGFRDENGIGEKNLKYGAAYYPFLRTTQRALVPEDRIAVIESATRDTKTLHEIRLSDPELYKAITTALTDPKYTLILPPSSAIAGVYAQVDREWGVWKAPANIVLMSVLKPMIKITEEDQDKLNVSPDGKSINGIRSFVGKGTLVWGARTMAGIENEWRYISIRRLFNMIETSAIKASYFVVFEPNDASTWLKVKGILESYLYGLWQQGALAGKSPEEAYFVHVGLGITMTALDITEGKLIVELGVAAVRPQEFITLMLVHKLNKV